MPKSYTNSIKRRLSLIKGEYLLCDENGQVVYDINDAYLLLGPQYKVVQDSDGNHYLLRKNQDFNTIQKEQPHLLPQLKRDFEVKKNEFLAMKAYLKEQKKLIVFSSHGLNVFQIKWLTFMIWIIRIMINNNLISKGDSGDDTDNLINTVPVPRLKPGVTNHQSTPGHIVARQTPVPRTESKVVLNSMTSSTRTTLKPTAPVRSVDPKFNPGFVNSPYSQALSPESMKLGPFLAYTSSDLRMQSLLKHLERWGVDAAKANVADLDFSYELSSGVTYETPTPFASKQVAKPA